MGDAAGIGPEIVLKALEDKNTREASRCVIIGDASYLRKAANELVSTFQLAEFGSQKHNAVEVFDLANLPDEFAIGVDSGITGKASAENIEDDWHVRNRGPHQPDGTCARS